MRLRSEAKPTWCLLGFQEVCGADLRLWNLFPTVVSVIRDVPEDCPDLATVSHLSEKRGQPSRGMQANLHIADYQSQ